MMRQRWMRRVGGFAAVALLVTGCDQLPLGRSPGEKIYRARCAECHGVDGRGNTPRYISNANADIVDDVTQYGTGSGAVETVVRDGIFGVMPANPDLSELEMAELLAWIRHLQQGNRS